MKIYTKTGDQGETGLIGGERVPKDHLRVAAYGDVDETNAAIGVAVALETGASQLRELLLGTQRDLLALGAQLADPTAKIGEKEAKAVVDAASVERLEAAIDEREATLPPLTAFILPGGSPVGAQLQLARTVCRRAERSTITLSRSEPIDRIAIVYLNRLSDLLFVLARHTNHAAGLREPEW